MQEHEYVHEYGYINKNEPIDAEVSKREEETVNEQAKIEDLDELEDAGESKHRRFMLWLGRSLVITLVLSFLACLAAFWFSGTLLSAPDHLLPMAFLQALASQRLLVLSAPAVCLVICYVALRSLTSGIMVVPERYLDERQKMLRDQAHRSAFQVIKFACLLIPCGFLVPHLPWFSQPASSVPPGVFYSQPLTTMQIIGTQGMKAGSYHNVVVFPTITWRLFQFEPVIPPATTAEIVLACVLLLLSLFLIASALPMAVLAWKGKE